MRVKIFLTVLIMSLFLPVVAGRYAFAQESGNVLKISLSVAIDMALETSEELKLRDNEVKRKTSEKKEEKAAMFPKIMGAVNWSNNFEYPDITSTSTTKSYHIDSGVTVNQTVFTFGRISHAISAAQKALAASCFDYEGSRQSVIYETKIAFYNACLARRILEIAEESYDNALRNKEILEDRSSGGRASKFDNIKVSADVASRRPTVNNARADFLSAMETLKVIIGAETGDSITLMDDFYMEYPDFDRQELAMSLYNNQPAIKALAKAIEEKEDLVRSKKAYLFPEIGAFANWNHKGDSDDYHVGGDNLHDYGVAGLKVSIPIWLGGISREKLYQAKIEKKDAELKYQQGQEEYLLLLDKAVNEYREYKKTLEANHEATRLAEESFQYSQELLGSGQISVTDLNDAELQLMNAKISKEVTLFNLNSTLAVIGRLTLVERDDD